MFELAVKEGHNSVRSVGARSACGFLWIPRGSRLGWWTPIVILKFPTDRICSRGILIFYRQCRRIINADFHRAEELLSRAGHLSVKTLKVAHYSKLARDALATSSSGPVDVEVAK